MDDRRLQVSSECFLEVNFPTLKDCFFTDSVEVEGVDGVDDTSGGPRIGLFGMACSNPLMVSLTNSGDYIKKKQISPYVRLSLGFNFMIRAINLPIG
jgi:hypothetical protein